ncbi:MAG: tetratricopeptide repeat protein [Cyanobacteria bacterium P01_H01_bin.26]
MPSDIYATRQEYSVNNFRIDELLQQCTVKLSVPENGQFGTGFFIMPGYILTCEHVVRGAAAATVSYKQNENYTTATVEQIFADKDVALLRFEPSEDLPCVLLSTDVPEVGSQISTFGYPYRYDDDGIPWQAIPALLIMEGTTGNEPPYLQLSLGNVLPGMSGGPLLNRATGQVCGMLKFTRDDHSVMGGGGVSGSTIAQCIPDVIEAQQWFHQQDGRWRDALPKEQQTSSPPKGISNNLQERGSSNFVGRNQTLKELHEKLQPGQTLAITALQGMGGIGKTEMAVQYAQRYKSHYPSGVCWLSARGAEVGTQLVKFAVTVLGLTQPEGELADQVQSVWNWWPRQDNGERVLLIYDDVADYGDIEGLLPTDERFQVLLTTRLQNLAAGVEDFRLELLSKEASLQLLRKIVDGAGTTRINAELAIAEALCERVGYLPLGLELLGYFLKNKPRMPLQKLQQRLKKNQLNAKAFQTAHPGMTAKLGVYEAFELSWAELSEAGQGMACWLSLFGLAPIPWGLASAGVREEDQDDWADTRDDEPLKLSLLKDLDGNSYQLHQLVREFFLAKLEERKDKENLKEAYCGLMRTIASQMPQSPTQELISQLSPIVPHMEEVTTRWLSSLGDEENELLGPFVFLARFYHGQGAYAQAELRYESSLKATLERFGEVHPDVATSLNNLAASYRSQGRYGEAEPLYLEALALRKQLLGEAHPDLATSLNNLADLYDVQGRYEEAEPLYLEALARQKQLLGEAHPNMATSLNNLAGLYGSQGRYEEAEPLYLEALDLRKQLLGEAHPDVAISLNNLAKLYSSQGRYEEAKPLYLEALMRQKQLLGEQHPSVAASLNNLAELHEFQGCYEEAERLYLRALDLRKQLLGEAHPDVATSLSNLAGLYGSQGRYEEAEPLYLQALALQKQLLGEQHPSVATSLNNLAGLYGSQGRYEEAESLHLQVLELHKQLLGEAHPSVATSLNNLAKLYRFQGRYREAEPLYLQALALHKQLLGEAHPNVASSLNNLAELYHFQGRHEEAEPLYLEALALRKQLLGEAHPDVATSLNNLASLYDVQGRYEESEPLHLQALALQKQLLGEAHPSVATSLNNLAELYRFQGRYGESETLHLQALDLTKQLLGEAHPDVATSLNNLANLYDVQGRYEESEPLHLQALTLQKQLLGEMHPDVATSLNNLAVLYANQQRYYDSECLLRQALDLRSRLLGNEHPDTQSTCNSYTTLISMAIQANQAHTLSDNPMTQDLIPKIRAAMESQ